MTKSQLARIIRAELKHHAAKNGRKGGRAKSHAKTRSARRNLKLANRAKLLAAQIHSISPAAIAKQGKKRVAKQLGRT